MRLLLSATLVSAALCAQAHAGAISSAGDPALAGASVINFDALSLGPVGSLDLGGGISVGGTPAGVSIDNFSGSYNTTGQALDNNGGESSAIMFSFTTPLDAFGFDYGAGNVAGGGTLTVYGHNGSVIGTVNLPPNDNSCNGNVCGNDGAYHGFAGHDITAATVTEPADVHVPFDFVLLDNFAYVDDPNPNAGLPEPASALLVGIGVLGLGAIRRRRR